jgi:diacylglycerol kinase family enzyme
MKRNARENINKALFILNPSSGVPPVNFFVSKDLERRKRELSFCKSLNKEETICAIKKNFDSHGVFIAAGGDGTVHTVASELVGTEKILGVFPLGS